MLPSFLDLNSAGGVAGAPEPVQVPPPPGFQLPQLPIRRAVFGKRTAASPGRTAAQKAGLRYEKKILAALQEQFGPRFQESPTIYFEDQESSFRCIPDGLIRGLRGTLILEIKSQHMPESWWQLRKKYEPVLRWMFPGQPVLLLEICRSLDISMPYPEKFEIISSVEEFMKTAPDGQLGVLQWRI